MNKKLFAALASATMAFTASGSIAVFADDFVEENNIVDNGDVKPTETKVKWNQENFGDLATKEGGVNPNSGLSLTLEEGYVKTDDLKKITTITLNAGFDGEVKGLEYFTGLTSFTAAAVTNKTLDFSENTKLATLSVAKAANLTGITLPGTYKNDKDEDVHALTSLTLDGTKLTSLDLSEQEKLGTIAVRENKNLKAITLRESTVQDQAVLQSLGLRDNALESINLDRYIIEGNLNLSGNNFGALDLSKTTVKGDVYLGDGNTDGDLAQKFYVSEGLENVNLAETFENLDVTAVKVDKAEDFNAKTGVLKLGAGATTTYTYEVALRGKTANMKVVLEKANPMNRLYNPNSGEHFYTASIREKEALVKLGWNDEGYGWVAPTAEAGKANPVYRLYNPNSGDHHYTMSKNEYETLQVYGWKDEKIGWYSADAENAEPSGEHVAVYRQYNPYANGAGSHNYTTDKGENDYLCNLGWVYEGIAWTALQ